MCMNEKDITHAINVLRNGGIIAHATETCYGFACDPFNEKALARLYALKKMAHTKPVALLVPDLKTAEQFGVFTPNARELAQKYWPGPLTIIVKRKKELPSFLNPGTPTIGMRVPDHELSLDFVKAFGGPLVTTSANITTQPSPYSAEEIKAQFKNEKLKPNFVIDSGVIPYNPPSTIVDCTSVTPVVIRQGSIFL